MCICICICICVVVKHGVVSAFFSPQDPNLWVQALSYFANKEENCKGYIMEVLTRILLNYVQILNQGQL